MNASIQRKKDDYGCCHQSELYGVASLASWSKSICNLGMGLQESEGFRRPLPHFESEHLERMQTNWSAPSISPKGKPLRS